jgi:cytochrome c oxidase subunit 1
MSMLPFFYNVYKSRKAPLVGVDDPWGWGRSLEWATSSPPPRHNFERLPRIRSESPAFDLHFPHVAGARSPYDQTDGDNLLVGSECQTDHQVVKQNVGGAGSEATDESSTSRG